MTLSELIAKVNREKPNAFSNEVLTGYVNEVEAIVYNFIETDEEERRYYTWADDQATELVVKAPYDTMYESYVKAKIDYATEEYQSYANNQAQFSSDVEAWEAYAMRKHQVNTSELPKQIINWF